MVALIALLAFAQLVVMKLPHIHWLAQSTTMSIVYVCSLGCQKVHVLYYAPLGILAHPLAGSIYNNEHSLYLLSWLPKSSCIILCTLRDSSTLINEMNNLH